MYIIGEMRDKKMIDKMCDELKSMGVEARSIFDSKQGTYFLIIDEASQVEKALDYYRVTLGFKKVSLPDVEWIKIKSLPRGVITYSLIVVCVVVFIMQLFPQGNGLYDLFFMGKKDGKFLSEILRGEFWRAITPIFLHMSIIHLLFNMLWFRDLGYIIEFHFGKKKLILLIFLSGIISNFFQYVVSGPLFGGMSGVLYAMFGLLWVHKGIHSEFEYGLPRRDVYIMVGWLFLCMTGLLGPIANIAHAGGLFVGMLFSICYTLIATGKRLDVNGVKYLFYAFLILAMAFIVEGIKLNGKFYVHI